MGKLKIERCVLGAIGTNCYLVSNGDSGEAVVIDPADNGPFILNRFREKGLTPTAVLLTHGHMDHMMAVEDIQKAFRIPLYAGADEADVLGKPEFNLSADMGGRPVSLSADVPVRDGQVLELIGFQWKVIGTPGHTAGSVCYYIEEQKTLFSGDTLFSQSYGRTDFPTGSYKDIIESITEKLLTLPGDTDVYPGHEDSTTIAYEKKYNPAVGLTW